MEHHSSWFGILSFWRLRNAKWLVMLFGRGWCVLMAADFKDKAVYRKAILAQAEKRRYMQCNSRKGNTVIICSLVSLNALLAAFHFVICQLLNDIPILE